MSDFKQIVKFFNSKTSNKIFTRAEYFTAMKPYKIMDSYKDTVRCYLMAAGYLRREESGVYRKVKKIPDTLTITQLQKEGYPKMYPKLHAKSERRNRRVRSENPPDGYEDPQQGEFY